jgi:hypothetical protein
MTWFVGRPIAFFVVAAVFTLIALARTRTDRPTIGAAVFVVPIVAWMLGGLWELFVTSWSPEADLRLDLVFTLPLLAAISAWSLVRMVVDSRKV